MKPEGKSEYQWGRYQTEPLYDLERVSVESGREILKNKGLKGNDMQLDQVVRSYDHDTQALELLGNYLGIRHKGDLSKLDTIPILLDHNPAGRSTRRVLVAYESWFSGSISLPLLYLLSLFERPIPFDKLGIVLSFVKISPSAYFLGKEKVYSQLFKPLKRQTQKQWIKALQQLRAHGLIEFLSESNIPEEIYIPKTIRQYFSDRFQKRFFTVWKKLHLDIYKHYKQIAFQNQSTPEPDNNLFRTIVHACLAGQYQEAWDELYWPYVQKKQGIDQPHQDDPEVDLYLLSAFFTQPWTEPDRNLNISTKLAILCLSAANMVKLDQYSDAIRILDTAFCLSHQSKNWQASMLVSQQQRSLYLTINDRAKAIEATRYSMAYAHLTGDKTALFDNQGILDRLLISRGEKSVQPEEAALPA